MMNVATAVAFSFVFGVFFGTLIDRLMRKFYAWLDKRTEEKDSPLGFSDPLYAELEAEKYREAVEDWEEICNEK